MSLTARNTVRPVNMLRVDFEYVSVSRPKEGAANAIAEPTYAAKPLHILEYDAETTAFTVGETVTGATSGATGVVVNDFPNPRVATRGWLTLRRDAATTAYQDNEVLNGSTGGNAMAVANGASFDEFKCRIYTTEMTAYMFQGNMRNILPQGEITTSTHVMYLNHGFDSDGSGIEPGDTITDVDGNVYFALNMLENYTHLSALLQKDA